MPILFAISVLALIALLWASISAAQHIRRTRRRKRRAGVAAPPPLEGRLDLKAASVKPGPELSFEEITPYMAAVISRPGMPVAKEPAAMEPVAVPVETRPAFSLDSFFRDARQSTAPVEDAPPVATIEPEVVSIPPATNRPEVESEIRDWEHFDAVFAAAPEPRTSFESAPVMKQAEPVALVAEAGPAFSLQSAICAAQERARGEQEQVAHSSAEAAGVIEPRLTAEAVPQRAVASAEPASDQVVRPALGKPPVSAGARTMERQDWAYFNKDMGDLTDPYETPRSRSKIMQGAPRR